MASSESSLDITLEVEPDFRVLADLRRQLRGWLGQRHIGPPIDEEALLVATELCTNAIEASATDDPIEIRLSHDGEALRLAVVNSASGGELEPPRDLEPGSLQERGRGLAIVKALVDNLVMKSVDGRTVVCTTRLL